MNRSSLALIATLLILWLLLNNTLELSEVLLGMGVAVATVITFRDFRPVKPTLRHPLTLARLVVHVVLDIVQSNLAVARLILGFAGPRTARSAFVQIPLKLRDPHGLAVLATIVTSTPGTVWAGLAENGTLTLHVLNVQDESALVRFIQDRYEKPLREIFE
jgi:multicomponent K+:H+ antiporter subunit E